MIIAKPIFTDERIYPEYDMAFVIMPFGEKWSDYIYRDYIAPALHDCGLSALRADEMYGRNVLHDIWRGIASSRLVVADLSVPNENVFYELGIAHTLGKPTVLLTQDVSRIPFDLRSQRMIVYTDDHPGYKVLALEMPRHFNAIIKEPIDEVHHVTSLFGGFIIEQAEQELTLQDIDSKRVAISDRMEVIGSRENVILVNKMVESDGKVDDFKCNHRFIYTEYPDIIKMAALFDPPYLGIGDRKTVKFNYNITKGFKSDKVWSYDCSVDVKELRFVLHTPHNYRGTVKIMETIKPTDYDIKSLLPQETDQGLVFEGIIKLPKTGSTYAMRWT